MAKKIRKSSIVILIISLVALGASAYISFFSSTQEAVSRDDVNQRILDDIMETGIYNLTFTEGGESYNVALVPLESSYDIVLGEILNLLRDEGRVSINVPISDTESQEISLIPEALAYDVVIPEIMNFVEQEGYVTLTYQVSEDEIREITLVPSNQ